MVGKVDGRYRLGQAGFAELQRVSAATASRPPVLKHTAMNVRPLLYLCHPSRAQQPPCQAPQPCTGEPGQGLTGPHGHKPMPVLPAWAPLQEQGRVVDALASKQGTLKNDMHRILNSGLNSGAMQRNSWPLNRGWYHASIENLDSATQLGRTI